MVVAYAPPTSKETAARLGAAADADEEVVAISF
jgi:hypothetical protein